VSDFGNTTYWFDSADYDLQTARAMLEAKSYLYVGFMCQQILFDPHADPQ